MKKIIFTIALLAFAGISHATITIVDINGAGQFTSIQAAINNAFTGDTIQVWPGTYIEAININKNVILQGSGYENTIITGSNTFTVTMSTGLIKWFMISSSMGTGIKMTGGTVKNCVIKGCSGVGIDSNGSCYIQNCIVINNGAQGIIGRDGQTLYVTNTISWSNTNEGFYSQGCNSFIYKSYSDGSNGGDCGARIYGNQGCVSVDPIFVSPTNYHLSTGSPCYNTGQPSLSDPDGSQSDMGYFGGPDCPIFPVVYEMTISPNGNNINVQAKARANY